MLCYLMNKLCSNYETREWSNKCADRIYIKTAASESNIDTNGTPTIHGEQQKHTARFLWLLFTEFFEDDKCPYWTPSNTIHAEN